MILIHMLNLTKKSKIAKQKTRIEKKVIIHQEIIEGMENLHPQSTTHRDVTITNIKKQRKQNKACFTKKLGNHWK